ncbi:hypothetical protein GF327_01400 [Candidatus Woesearchaeota archaeon]|nr:hypothetical protein [Candidatus Woesearchaeota archaeon]
MQIRNFFKNIDFVILLFILFLAVGIRIFFNTMPIDDAMITFRIAKNTASGNGMVYNSGDKVLSTTTPLYILILAVFNKLGIDLFFISDFIGIISSLVTIIITYFFFKDMNMRKTGLLACFILAFINDYVVYSMNAMETSLYIMLWIISIFAYNKNKYWLCGFFLGLLIFTRVDGIILAVVLGTLFLMNKRQIPWKMMVSCIIVLLPWIIYSISYFGVILPNTLSGKQLQAAGRPVFLIVLFGFLYDESYLLFLPFFIFGIIKLVGKEKAHAVIFWQILYVIFYTLFKLPAYMWYYMPLIPGIVFIGSTGIINIHKTFKKKKRFLSKAAASLFLIGMIFALFSSSILGIKHYKQKAEPRLYTYRNLGKWLKQNTEKNSTIFFHDIGYVGYFSDRYIYDDDFILHKSPEGIKRKFSYSRFIEYFKPDFVVALKQNNLKDINKINISYNGYRLIRKFKEDYTYHTDDLRYELRFNYYFYIFKKE